MREALRAPTTHRHDYLGAYVADLGNVVDLDAIRDAKVKMGVDPLGGAGVHYWARIAEHYRLDLTVVSDEVDETFRFMTADWDGQIRMDPSSPYAMQRLLDAQGPLRHRLRLRHRPRPARHRHRRQRPARAEPLPRGGDRLPVPRTGRSGRRTPPSARRSSARG